MTARTDIPADDAEVFRRIGSRATRTHALVEDPPVFVAAAGARLTDNRGRSYLDFACGSGTSSVGHGNPAVLAAVRELLDRGVTHIGPHFHTDVQARFYRLLRGWLPPALTRIHPASNGTEATEAAIKACMHATGERRFVAFTGGYHGRTLGSLAVSHARGANAVLAPLAPKAEFLPFPSRAEETDTILARLTGLAHRTGLAGVIVEPIQATAGMRVPPAGFLAALAAACRRRGIPLVIDEIFTGMGRTGELFASTGEVPAPDLLLLGKSFGGGFPGGAVAGQEAILSAWPPGAQSSTFQLHPATAAAGHAALQFLVDHDLAARARRIGDRIRAHGEAFLRCPSVAGLRGRGAMQGLVMAPMPGRSAPAAARAVRRMALRSGLITWECGPAGEVIGLVPPLVIEMAEIDAGCGLLLDALRRLDAADGE